MQFIFQFGKVFIWVLATVDIRELTQEEFYSRLRLGV
jgi:hypothetical protein